MDLEVRPPLSPSGHQDTQGPSLPPVCADARERSFLLHLEFPRSGVSCRVMTSEPLPVSAPHLVGGRFIAVRSPAMVPSLVGGGTSHSVDTGHGSGPWKVNRPSPSAPAGANGLCPAGWAALLQSCVCCKGCSSDSCPSQSLSGRSWARCPVSEKSLRRAG